ncbi:MAG: hypothetical protein U0350_17715 [Caldilineaceae bacterium]
MEPTKMTLQQVKQRMDRGEALVFLDDRNPQAWAASNVKLPGAFRVPADAVQAHLAEIPRDATVVTYCT